MRPLLVVLSSPSGGGKTSIARQLLAARPDVGYSVSATTRPPRSGEQDGRDYHFLPRNEFERRVAAGEFVEHAAYGGNLYGTLRAEIERIFAARKHAVLDIEVEGARQIRQTVPGAVRVFVLPPSGGELIRRLEARRTEDRATLRRRLDRADEELAAVGEYDYAIVNDNLDHAVARVSAILDAETKRVPRQDGLTEFVSSLRREIQRARDHG
ncbi:MAG TPA: guanylate kinase [Gemmatimonadales bacterium]|nr:guanylate kinase [Gemmatimonadales bacterium]